VNLRRVYLDVSGREQGKSAERERHFGLGRGRVSGDFFRLRVGEIGVYRDGGLGR